MNEIIISILTGIGAVTVSVIMLLLIAFCAVWTIIFIVRIASFLDSEIHILFWRHKIPAHEWKRIREIALPYVSKK